MKLCPKCQSYSPPSYALCQSCGTELPKGGDGDGAIYGRGLIEVAKTRVGMRIIAMLVAVIFIAIWSLINGR